MKNFSDDDIQFLGGEDYKPSIVPNTSKWKRLISKRYVFATIASVVVLTFGFLAIKYYYKHYYWAVDFDYPLSRSCRQIIDDLQKSISEKNQNNSFKVDSIDGVPMHMLDLKGLKAEIAEQIPSDSDSTVVLVTQAWDYYLDDNKQYHYLGEFIKDGKQIRNGKGRAGFVMITDKGWQIGISQSDSITDYVIGQHGSMFRQFALVSAGQICLKQFALKGKVHRRALARKPGYSTAFYIETLNKESLYDFAEALSDYGFVDAIYLTGGDGNKTYYNNGNGGDTKIIKDWNTKCNLLLFRNLSIN